MVEIYSLHCPDSGELRYIGKANNAADRLKSHVRDSRRRATPLYGWIRVLLNDGKLPILRVVATVTADEWPQAERSAIKHARENGVALLNVAIGGKEPFCARDVRARNGRKNAVAIHGGSNPKARRLWEIKRDLGEALCRGYVREDTKAKIRLAMVKRPDLFGCFAGMV